MALHVQHHNSLGQITNFADEIQPDSDLLCEQCQALDLHAAFSQITFLGTRPVKLEGAAADCPLCNLFLEVGKTYPKRRSEYEQPRSEYTIESTEYRHVIGVTDKVNRMCGRRVFCIVVYPTGYGPVSTIVASQQRISLRSAILRANPGKTTLDSKAAVFRGRVVRPDAIDYNLIGDWLKWCYDHHPDICFKALPAAARKLRAINMRLIDCISGKIRAYQEGDTYAALSYVWGPTAPEPDWYPIPGTMLPRDPPRTIADAIRVCQRLRIRYIWVDQYCIAQSDARDQNRQFACMKEIYAQASLVLFAAAGMCSGYGLPGVSKTTKEGPLPVQIQGMTLVSSLRRPAHLIDWSPWGSRAWCYQEGVLANRRLIFTTEQVSFECRGMHCVESIERPLRLMSTPTLQTLRSDVRPDYFRANCNPYRRRLGIKTTRTKIWQHITAFNKRKLTKESDRLDAFSGVLAEYGTCNIVGIPVDSCNFGRAEKWAKSARISKATVHEVSFIAALCWHTNSIRSQKKIVPQKRRPGLPSFSWMGWTGKIYFELVRNAFGKKGEAEKVYRALASFSIFKEKIWRQPTFTDRAKEGLFCTGETMEIWIKSTVPSRTIALLSIQSRTDPVKQLEFPRESFRLSCPKMAKDYNRAAREDLPCYHVMVDGYYDALLLMDYMRYGEVERTYLLLFERFHGYVERIGLLELSRYKNHLEKLKTWPTQRRTLLLK